MDEVYLVDADLNPLVYRHGSFVWPRAVAEAAEGDVLDRNAWQIAWVNGRWTVRPRG